MSLGGPIIEMSWTESNSFPVSRAKKARATEPLSLFRILLPVEQNT